MSVHRGYKYTAQQGFALPTVLITSVVMMIVLLAALNSISSISVSIQNQYYSKLAQLAAESGAAVARACIQASPDGRAQWGNGVLTPDRNCDGSIRAGSPSNYVLDTPQVKTTFIVRAATTDSSNLPVKFSVEGKTTQHRLSNGISWRSYDSSLNVSLNRSNAIVNDLGSGTGATCAAVDYTAYCWGDQSDGRLGNGQTSGLQRSPQPVIEEAGLLEGRRVIQVSVAQRSACALAVLPGNTAGQVFCWGDNSEGQLGNENTVSSSKPVAVKISASSGTTPNTTAGGLPQGESITKIATGRTYACAVTVSGRDYCWGNNSSGQLGLGNTTSSTVPRLIVSTLTSDVKDVYAGSGTKTTCALRTLSGADRLYCWGNNRQGQVGNGTTATSQTNPVLVSGNFGVASGNVLNASVGGARGGTDSNFDDTTEGGFVCAVGGGNRGYCWGSNRYAQTGHDSTVTGASETAITTPQEVFYSSFQSGGINYANYTRTTSVGGNIEKIVTGWGTACALRTTRPAGTVFDGNPPSDPYHATTPTSKALLCWGNNEFSNLGLNDAPATKSGYANEWSSVPLPPDQNTTSSMLALRVPRHMPAFGPSSQLHQDGITDLYGGGHRMCVVTGNKLYCWGNNSTGQVGSSKTNATPIGWPILADHVERLKRVYYY